MSHSLVHIPSWIRAVTTRTRLTLRGVVRVFVRVVAPSATLARHAGGRASIRGVVAAGQTGYIRTATAVRNRIRIGIRTGPKKKTEYRNRYRNPNLSENCTRIGKNIMRPFLAVLPIFYALN